MSKLDDALGRLERAVARVEKALDAMGENERTRIATLVAAQADYSALAATTDRVASRLDAAIIRLDRALEG